MKSDIGKVLGKSGVSSSDFTSDISGKSKKPALAIEIGSEPSDEEDGEDMEGGPSEEQVQIMKDFMSAGSAKDKAAALKAFMECCKDEE